MWLVWKLFVRPVAKSLLTLVFFSLRQFLCTSDIYCWSICWAVLCFAGWILCCPCWTLGYCLRDPPSYYYYYDYDHQHPQHYHHRQQQQQQQAEMLDDDEELSVDPCWPCDSRRNTNTRRPRLPPAKYWNSSSLLWRRPEDGWCKCFRDDFAVDFDIKRVSACVANWLAITGRIAAAAVIDPSYSLAGAAGTSAIF